MRKRLSRTSTWSAALGALACSRHAGLDRIVARQPERGAVHRGAAGYAYRITAPTARRRLSVPWGKRARGGSLTSVGLRPPPRHRRCVRLADGCSELSRHFRPGRLRLHGEPRRHHCANAPGSVTIALRRRQRGGQLLDANVRELTIIALVSCFSLGLAWAYEADLFAMFFAAAAAIAGVEAVRRSL
jgi:hypothetical protein